jgi:hypothetical protein
MQLEEAAVQEQVVDLGCGQVAAAPGVELGPRRWQIRLTVERLIVASGPKTSTSIASTSRSDSPAPSRR